jgi:hypothetical protein
MLELYKALPLSGNPVWHTFWVSPFSCILQVLWDALERLVPTPLAFVVAGERAACVTSATALARIPASTLIAVGTSTGLLSVVDMAPAQAQSSGGAAEARAAPRVLCSTQAHAAAISAVVCLAGAGARPSAPVSESVLLASACAAGTVELSALVPCASSRPNSRSDEDIAAANAAAGALYRLDTTAVLIDASEAVLALHVVESAHAAPAATADAVSPALPDARLSDQQAAAATVHVRTCRAADAGAKPAHDASEPEGGNTEAGDSGMKCSDDVQLCSNPKQAAAGERVLLLVASGAGGKLHHWRLQCCGGSVTAGYCGVFASVSKSATPRMFATLPCIQRVAGGEGAVYGQRLLAACGDRCIRAWDLNDDALAADSVLPTQSAPTADADAASSQVVDLACAGVARLQLTGAENVCSQAPEGAACEAPSTSAGAEQLQQGSAREGPAAAASESADTQAIRQQLPAPASSAGAAPVAAAAAIPALGARPTGQRPRGTALGRAPILQPLLGLALTSAAPAASSSREPDLPGCLADSAAAERFIAEVASSDAAPCAVAAASAMSGRAARVRAAHAAALPHLWQGDVAAALEAVTAAGALNSDFVAMAAALGHDAWLEAAKAHAAQLAAAGELHLAAGYLCAAREWGSAVDVYAAAGLLPEALTLAERHLPAGDGSTATLRRQLLVRLEHAGAGARRAGREVMARVARGAGDEERAAQLLQMPSARTGPHTLEEQRAAFVGGVAARPAEPRAHDERNTEADAPVVRDANVDALPEIGVQPGALDELASMLQGADEPSSGAQAGASDTELAGEGASWPMGLSAAHVERYQRVEQALTPRDWARLRRQYRAAAVERGDAAGAGSGTGQLLETSGAVDPDMLGQDLLALPVGGVPEAESVAYGSEQDYGDMDARVQQLAASANVGIGTSFGDEVLSSPRPEGECVLNGWLAAVGSHPGAGLST